MPDAHAALPHFLVSFVLCLLQDMQRPLYMQPKDALEYGIIDGIVKSDTEIIDEVKSSEQWDRDVRLSPCLSAVFCALSHLSAMSAPRGAPRL